MNQYQVNQQFGQTVPTNPATVQAQVFGAEALALGAVAKETAESIIQTGEKLNNEDFKPVINKYGDLYSSFIDLIYGFYRKINKVIEKDNTEKKINEIIRDKILADAKNQLNNNPEYAEYIKQMLNNTLQGTEAEIKKIVEATREKLNVTENDKSNDKYSKYMESILREILKDAAAEKPLQQPPQPASPIRGGAIKHTNKMMKSLQSGGKKSLKRTHKSINDFLNSPINASKILSMVEKKGYHNVKKSKTRRKR